MGSKKKQRIMFRHLAKKHGVTEEYAKWVYDTSGSELKNVIMHMAKYSQRKAREK